MTTMAAIATALTVAVHIHIGTPKNLEDSEESLVFSIPCATITLEGTFTATEGRVIASLEESEARTARPRFKTEREPWRLSTVTAPLRCTEMDPIVVSSLGEIDTRFFEA
jgi:hypothetical protein